MNEALLTFLNDRDAYCPSCGYLLRCLTTERCPECGFELHLQISPVVVQYTHAWAALLCAVSAACGNGILWWLGGMTLFNMWEGDATPPWSNMVMLFLLLSPLFLLITLLLRKSFCSLSTATQWAISSLSIFFVLSCFLIFHID